MVNTKDPDLLRAALIGWTRQRDAALAQIKNIKYQIATLAGGTAASASSTGNRLSASARARIAAAQRKRWAAYRKTNGTVKKAKRARGPYTLSSEGRKAIAAATRKRWIAYRAAKAKANK